MLLLKEAAIGACATDMLKVSSRGRGSGIPSSLTIRVDVYIVSGYPNGVSRLSKQAMTVSILSKPHKVSRNLHSFLRLHAVVLASPPVHTYKLIV